MSAAVAEPSRPATYSCDAGCAARTRANALTRMPSSFCGSCRATASTTGVSGVTPSRARAASRRSGVLRPSTSGSRPRGITSMRSRRVQEPPRHDLGDPVRDRMHPYRRPRRERVERLSRPQAAGADPWLGGVVGPVAPRSPGSTRPASERPGPRCGRRYRSRRAWCARGRVVGTAPGRRTGGPGRGGGPRPRRRGRRRRPGSRPAARRCRRGPRRRGRYPGPDSAGPGRRGTAPPRPAGACRSRRGRGAFARSSTVGVPVIG